jgi:hypothetical protein
MGQKRQDVLTAGTGAAGLAGGAALREGALNRAYPEIPATKTEPAKNGRPLRLWNERVYLHHDKAKRVKAGRGRYFAGAALTAAAATPAVVGVNHLLRGHHSDMSKRDHPVLQETERGVNNSIKQRTEAWTDPAPANRQIQRFATNVGATSAGTGLARWAMMKVPRKYNKARSAAAVVAGLGTGVATLPLQNKIMGVTSHKKYRVTPTGVVSAKKKPVPASAMANQVDHHGNTVHKAMTKAQIAAARKLLEEQMPAPKKARSLFERYQPPDYSKKPRRRSTDVDKAMVSLERATKAKHAYALRQTRNVATQDFYSNLKRGRLLATSSVKKSEVIYAGSNLTHNQKRARVMAAGTAPLPIVGDIAAAKVAGSLAPPNLKHKTEALQFGGSMGGGTAGLAAGAYGGAKLTNKIPAVRRGAERLDNQITERMRKPIASGQQKVADSIHPKLAAKVTERNATNTARREKNTPGKLTEHLIGLAKHPNAKVARVGRAAIAVRKPLVGGGALGAALGGWAGQSAGSTSGSISGYTHALHLEDKQRVGKSQDNRHGSRISKLAPAPGMSQRQRKKMAHSKHQSAALSVAGGVTGLGALGTTIGSVNPKFKPTTRAKMLAATLPIVAVGGGLGAINSFKYAGIQHREAQSLSKGLHRLPRIPRIAPVKAATTRQGGLVRTNGVTRSRKGSV